MKMKHWVLLLVAVSLLLSISACQRSASKAPTAVPTGELPFPLPATDNAVSAIQTQTAIAQSGSIVVPQSTLPAESTPVPTATATVVVVIVPTATPGYPSTYTLQAGEWPYCIARRFNINAGQLLAANGLSNSSRPAVGYVLNLPQGASSWSNGSRSLISHPTSYTVKSGDTIYTIACAFGDVDPNAIIAANGLTSPYALTAGATLQIP